MGIIIKFNYMFNKSSNKVDLNYLSKGTSLNIEGHTCTVTSRATYTEDPYVLIEYTLSGHPKYLGIEWNSDEPDKVNCRLARVYEEDLNDGTTSLDDYIKSPTFHEDGLTYKNSHFSFEEQWSPIYYESDKQESVTIHEFSDGKGNYITFENWYDVEIEKIEVYYSTTISISEIKYEADIRDRIL